MRAFLNTSRRSVVWMAALAACAGTAGGCPTMEAAAGGDTAATSGNGAAAQGAPGLTGAMGDPGAAGLDCWDSNGNGVADPLEDVNSDGVFDARDCQGIFTVGAGLQLSGDQVALDVNFVDERYWKLGGNNLAGPFSLGTLDAQPLELLVNGSPMVRLRPDRGTDYGAAPSLIAGWSGNSAAADAVGVTISGGGSEFLFASTPTPQPNLAFDHLTTIGGGRNNIAGSDDGDPISSRFATVAGGASNLASGYSSTIGGGFMNTASDQSATVAGGQSNTASEEYACVGGGVLNVASGPYSTVAGGGANQTTGLYGTVAGGGSNLANVNVGTIGGGYNNILTQNYTTIPGGSGASADVLGQMAYGAGCFAAPGDAQMSFLVMRALTTDATTTRVRPGGTLVDWTLAPESSVAFDVLVAARSSTGAHGAYHILGSAEHQGGTITLIGVNVTTIDTIAGGIAITADDAAQAIAIEVTGAAGSTIRWVATVRMTEVRFPQ